MRFGAGLRIICAMGMPRCQPVTEKQLQGFKYFQKLLPLLDRLHDQRTERDRAGNRLWHYDQYLALMLLFLFNPIVTSMRGLVEASSLHKARQRLGVSPTSLGSFSEAGSIFDAQLLQPIIAELGRQLQPLPHDLRLEALPGVLTMVDGTELSALIKLADSASDGRDIPSRAPEVLYVVAARTETRSHRPGSRQNAKTKKDKTNPFKPRFYPRQGRLPRLRPQKQTHSRPPNPTPNAPQASLSRLLPSPPAHFPTFPPPRTRDQ